MNEINYQKVEEVRKHLRDLMQAQWMEDSFLTWKWWLLLFLTIIPIIIWWKIVDKKRLFEILSYGCLCAITTVVFDGFGTASLWWGYPIKLIPQIPPYLPVDIVLVPIWFMILYQLFSRNFKAFLIANIIQATTFSYVFEPLFVWLDLYKLNTWKFSYSFLYYIIVANFFRWLMLKMKTVQVK